MTRRSREKGAPAAVRLGGTPAAGTKQKQRRMPSPCVMQSSVYTASAVAAPVAPVACHLGSVATGRPPADGALPPLLGGWAAAQGGPLGIVTRTSSQIAPLGVVDPETGEILARHDRQKARAKRWELKASADSIRPNTRTSKCCKFFAPSAGGGTQLVRVMKSQAHGAAHYKGLMVCGSVWHCPICAAKIAERRREELETAVEAAKARGWGVHFVTLTVPHGVGDDVSVMLDKLSNALKLMSSGNRSGLKHQLSSIDDNAKVLGFVRALEVTHGKNGWHPHYHLIVFTPRSIGCSIVQHAYEAAWLSACRRSGLPEPRAMVGVTVQDGGKAARYASKWGIQDEMTRSQAKQGKTKGLSPWGFLRVYQGESHPDYSKGRAAALFREYADAFKGRRQLYWSNGLRALLQLSQEASDQELAEQDIDSTALLLGTLSVGQWARIRKARAQCAVLDAAEAGADAFVVLIVALTGSPPIDDLLRLTG